MSVVKFIEQIIIVLKGAKKKSSDLHFSTRICKATYGVKTNSPFEEGTDPEDKKTIVEGDVLCEDRFDKHVEIHQAVGIDEALQILVEIILGSKPNNTAPLKTASPASCGIINE
jgi:hypothetical protein